MMLSCYHHMAMSQSYKGYKAPDGEDEGDAGRRKYYSQGNWTVLQP